MSQTPDTTPALASEEAAPETPAQSTPPAPAPMERRIAPPVLIDRVTARIKKDGAEARGAYGLGDFKLDSAGIKAIAHGVRAAQREVNEWAEGIDLAPMLADASSTAAGMEKVEALRKRLRVPDNASVGEILVAVLQGAWRRDAIMLCPLNKPIEPWVHWAHLAIVKRMPWVGYDQVAFPSLVYARNKLVDNFLKTEAAWAFWLDGDTVPPIGDPGAMYHRFGADPRFVKPEYLSFQGLERLLVRQKSLIGAVVADRHAGNRLIIQPDLNPRNDSDRELVKILKTQGPQDKVVQVPYIGTGCAAVHRSVFEDIAKKFPERGPRTAGEPFNFFGGGGGVDAEGEDIAFCKLAAEAGHPAFLDLSVFCAHVGAHSFFPQLQL